MEIVKYSNLISWECILVHTLYQYQINTFCLPLSFMAMYLRKIIARCHYIQELLEIKEDSNLIGWEHFQVCPCMPLRNYYILLICLTTFCLSLLQFQAETNGYIFFGSPKTLFWGHFFGPFWAFSQRKNSLKKLSSSSLSCYMDICLHAKYLRRVNSEGKELLTYICRQGFP